MSKDKKNNLSIFLIKEGISDHSDIVENIRALDKKEFKDEAGGMIGILYYPKSFNKPPDWLSNFFGINDIGIPFFNSSTKAIFISESAGRVFALIFGRGKNLLKKEVYDDDFGLLTTLNLLVPDTLRSIEKTDLAMSGKKSKEQLIASGDINSFGIDIEQNLINEVSGKSKIEELGGIVSGKESFHAKIIATWENINTFLPKYLSFYQKEDYKENFNWINNIKKETNKKITEELNEKLIEKFKEKSSEKIWLAIPELVKWSDIEGFKYGRFSPKVKEKIYDDLYVGDLKEFLSDKIDIIGASDLKNKYHVFCGFNFEDDNYLKWSIYQCIYCEIQYNDDCYILSNGSWYKVINSFVDDINERYKSISSIELNLPEYNEKKYSGKGSDKGEYGYNRDVVKNNDDYILFDRENINIGGGRNKVEFCDLFCKSKKQIIHVKKYGGSNIFSHLFNQGLVSGELMLSERKFRQEVNNKLSVNCKLKDVNSTPKAGDYSIVFAVISGSKKELDIPFFSKISFCNIYRRLKIIMGFNVYKSKILKISDED